MGLFVKPELFAQVDVPSEGLEGGTGQVDIGRMPAADELEVEALALQEALDDDAVRPVRHGQALAARGTAALERRRRAGRLLQQRQELLDRGQGLLRRRAQAQASLVHVADGGLAAEDLGLQDREHPAETQVVPEGPVRVLVGEQGIFVVVLFDFDDFLPHAGGEILGPCGQHDARKGDRGNDSFHMPNIRNYIYL